tara:strand:- start:43 stop:933 length:891 start_codon:yes stop_codon:yes gene_type:complete
MAGLNKIKKAIIPVAGLGTRMLPATKAIPKELLPIVDKPIIQYVVEEAVDAGIKEIILVTRSGKEAIENHFDKNYELEHRLKNAGKDKILKSIESNITNKVTITSIRQEDALGLGHAISCAKNLIQNQPFAVLLPDEFLYKKNKDSDLKLMTKNFNKTGIAQILIEETDKKNALNYGIVKFKKNFKDQNHTTIEKFIEKPRRILEKKPSRIIGRYILPFQIMNILEGMKPKKNKEIQLTDALSEYLMKNPGSFNGIKSKSKIFDCGSKKGFLSANMYLSMQDDEMRQHLSKILKNY